MMKILCRLILKRLLKRTEITDMKIPKSVKIGGQNYKIIIKDLNKSECQDNCGYCRTTDNEIYINSSMSQEQQETTLLHEILEALNFNYQLDLEHNKIQTLEATLYQVLKDNKLF